MSDLTVRKRELQDFYDHFTGQVPSDDKIEGILTKYAGAEDDLYSALCGKYQLNEGDVKTRRRWMARLEAFYAQYAPDSAQKAAGLMKKNGDNVPELLNALRSKYGVSESDFPDVAPTGKTKKQAAPPPSETATQEASAAAASPVVATSQAATVNAPPSPPPPSQPTEASGSTMLEEFQKRNIVLATQQKVREQALMVRETALKALGAAVEAKMDSLAVIPPARAAPWSQPAEVSLDVNNQFLSHLATLEGQLLQRACDLTRLEALVGDRERAVASGEASLAARREQLEKEFDAFAATRTEDLTLRTAQAAALEERQRYCDRLAPQLEKKEAALQAREEEVDAKLRSVAEREAKLAAGEATIATQLANASEERELAKKLSEEVLKREATVRVVERSLNQARVELKKLEEDLAARTKKLLSDEAALRSWASDVDKRESKLTTVLEQLKKKGIVVSGL